MGCFPCGLPQLPRDYPAGFSTGMKSSCLLACLQIKGSKGILAEYAPVGNSSKHARSGRENGDQGRLKAYVSLSLLFFFPLSQKPVSIYRASWLCSWVSVTQPTHSLSSDNYSATEHQQFFLLMHCWKSVEQIQLENSRARLKLNNSSYIPEKNTLSNKENQRNGHRHELQNGFYLCFLTASHRTHLTGTRLLSLSSLRSAAIFNRYSQELQEHNQHKGQL